MNLELKPISVVGALLQPFQVIYILNLLSSYACLIAFRTGGCDVTEDLRDSAAAKRKKTTLANKNRRGFIVLVYHKFYYVINIVYVVTASSTTTTSTTASSVKNSASADALSFSSDDSEKHGESGDLLQKFKSIVFNILCKMSIRVEFCR